MNPSLARGLAAAIVVASTALPAAAHVTLDPPSAVPGTNLRATLRVPHGCEGKATNALHVDIPAGVFSVKPMPKSGWTLATDRAAYGRAYLDHGREVKEGVRRITWSGGQLPDAQYEEFVFIGQVAPDVAPGTPLYFAATQTCGEATMAWTEIPADGQKRSDLKAPAPVLAISAAGLNAMAQADISAGTLVISPPWTRATPGGAKVGGGYMKITNKGTMSDRLLSFTSPVAGRAEVHEMAMVNNIMTMRPLANGIEIPAGQSVELKPGGLHLMFMDLKQPMKEGEKVKATLRFEKAGTVDVEFNVQAIAAQQMAPAGEHKHH